MATAKPKQPPAVGTERSGAPPELPLVARLRLNLSALGIDAGAPDFAERLCLLSRDNEPYEFEYSAEGALIVMPPTSPDSSRGEQGINYGLLGWGLENPGETFPQTVMFHLPSGARYMPDASWINQERYDSLTDGERRGTIDGAPDFVVEVRPWSDSRREGLAKMQEWMDGGVKLGWYIDPYARRAYIYRAGQGVEVLENPQTLSGEDVLSGFVFEVGRLVFDRYPV